MQLHGRGRCRVAVFMRGAAEFGHVTTTMSSIVAQVPVQSGEP